MQDAYDNSFLSLNELCSGLRTTYAIPSEQFDNPNIKRGLRNADGTGVIAGVTRVGSVLGYQVQDGVPVPVEGKLIYRGIDVLDIVDRHQANNTFGFEEVAYLLLFGSVPDAERLASFDEILSHARKLPDGFTEDMIIKAPSPDVMNKIARCVLALYSYDHDPDNLTPENLVRQCIELIGRLPVIVANADAVRRHYYNGESLIIHVPQKGLSVAENLLHMLRRDNSFTREEAMLLDMMLILHADHGGGNNSTFSCRVISSSNADTYGCISAAVSSLKGPLHGGANAKTMAMFRDIQAHVTDPLDDDEVYCYLKKMLDKEAGDRTGLIYGLGHAVYTVSDPRALLIKKYVKNLASRYNYTDDFELMERIEIQGLRALHDKLGGRKKVCANVDMYSGLVYKMLGFPEELYTPLFAISRIAGWCAHRIEEAMTGGRIIRPAYRVIP